MLSTDFCDWSEVTDGLLWETWTQRGRVRRGKERKTAAVAFFCHFSTLSQETNNKTHPLSCSSDSRGNVCSLCFCLFSFFSFSRYETNLGHHLQEEGLNISIISGFTFGTVAPEDEKMMCCTHPQWSCISPSRRRRECCTETHRPLHLRQTQQRGHFFLFVSYLFGPTVADSCAHCAPSFLTGRAKQMLLQCPGLLLCHHWNPV